MSEVLDSINHIVWGVPTLILIIGAGLYLTLRTGFAQFRLLPTSLRMFISTIRGRQNNDAGVSPFRALCTALAATVGTGNLAGVAGAFAIGGPGSIFWMWVCGFLGMVIKFAEAVLAVRFRIKDEHGSYIGGAMYIIEQGMGKRWRWLAVAYACFGVAAAFGVGNATQINVVVNGIHNTIVAFGGKTPRYLNAGVGIGVAVLLGLVLFGGAKRIGSVAEALVPAASVLYILLSVGVLFARYDAIPQAFLAIVRGAFRPAAVTGGAIGSMLQTLRVGTSRGIFTNEAGMGTAAIAHGSAVVTHPVKQGMMGIVEVFIDTIVICTLTAFAILCSGVPIPYNSDPGIALTLQAFCSVYGDWINIALSVAITLFAIATILGWGLYGIRCAQYLFGRGAWRWFAMMQVITVVVGAVLKTDTVWLLAEIMNALMTIPNLWALIILTPELCRFLKSYHRNGQYEKNIDI